MCVLDFPVTLHRLAVAEPSYLQTYSEELAQRGVVGLAWLALDVFLACSQPYLSRQALPPPLRTKSFVNQKRKHPSRRPSSSSESPMLMNVSGRSK